MDPRKAEYYVSLLFSEKAGPKPHLDRVSIIPNVTLRFLCFPKIT